MSSKLSLIISMLFFALFFFLCIDIMTIQFYYSDLDSKSISISYDISRKGDIDETYIVVREYKPIIISPNPIEIKVKRTTMIGYY